MVPPTPTRRGKVGRRLLDGVLRRQVDLGSRTRYPASSSAVPVVVRREGGRGVAEVFRVRVGVGRSRSALAAVCGGQPRPTRRRAG